MADNRDNNDIAALAGEYVLGTLNPAAQQEVERRLKSDPALAEAIATWQERLAPLLDSVAPVTPPAGTLDAVWRKLDELTNDVLVTELKRRLRNWRNASLAAGAIAAGLAAFIILSEVYAPHPSANTDQTFVAVLASDKRQPGFVASVDLARRKITIVRLSTPPPANKSYELWALGGGRQKPQSLGLVDSRKSLPLTRLGTIDGLQLKRTTLAISVEPPGGSPSGQPTGPVVFVGTLVPAAKP